MFRQSSTGMTAIFGLVLFTNMLSGCVRTPLSTPELEPETFRLAALSSTPVILECRGLSVEKVGSQYGLLILPLGTVTVPDSELVVYRSAYRVLAEYGVRPTKGGTSSGETTLRITLRGLSVNAYDLVFIRRVVIHSELLIETLEDPSQRTTSFTSVHKDSRFMTLPFAKELSAMLQMNLEQHLRESLPRVMKQL